MGAYVSLITDRFDLRTSEIIMLYAYRWQVELIFRFLKRTMNGLHLMCHHPLGIETQFTLYMISYLLLLHFKQKCAPVEIQKRYQVEPESYEVRNEATASESWKKTLSPSTFHVCGLVSLLGDRAST